MGPDLLSCRRDALRLGLAIELGHGGEADMAIGISFILEDRRALVQLILPEARVAELRFQENEELARQTDLEIHSTLLIV